MKNAGQYEKKIRKLLSGAPKGKPPPPATDEELVPTLILSVLTAEAPRKGAQRALDAFQAEYVDFNELRVAPAKEIADHMGRNFPFAREKADTLVRVLNAVFDKTSSMSMTYMRDMSKKDLRRHLAEVGLSPYSAAYVLLLAFGIHAIPLDMTLLDLLKLKEAAHGESQIEDAQAFLERAIGAKEAASAHEFFRNLIEKELKSVLAWRKANPDLVSKPPEILPPPKFKMIAKSQPLPPMKGDPGFEGEEELPAAIADIEETTEEVPDEAADVEVEEFEAPADEEAPSGPPSGKGGHAKPAKGDKKPPKKADKKR